jgi:hypothetical protein
LRIFRALGERMARGKLGPKVRFDSLGRLSDAKSASMLWPVSNRRSRSNRIKTIGLSVIALFFFESDTE